jgi:hypothetical protein
MTLPIFMADGMARTATTAPSFKYTDADSVGKIQFP